MDYLKFICLYIRVLHGTQKTVQRYEKICIDANNKNFLFYLYLFIDDRKWHTGAIVKKYQ